MQKVGEKVAGKVKVLFVCHGNICRSAMAEYILKNKAEKMGMADVFEISSAGTSAEEEGNPMYPPAREVLARHGITGVKNHRARQMTLSDYADADIIFAMDFHNMRNVMRISGNDPQGKLRMLIPDEIEDPWYTDNFEHVYNLIDGGCERFAAEFAKECGEDKVR